MRAIKQNKIWRFLFFVAITAFAISAYKHPVYVSVINMQYASKEKSMQITVHFYANDLEKALRKEYKTPMDVLHPKNKVKLDSAVYNYIAKRMLLSINNKKALVTYVGLEEDEKEKGSVYVYLEANKLTLPNTVKLTTTLLYETFTQQMLIIHTNVGAKRLSKKLVNPEREAVFGF